MTEPLVNSEIVESRDALPSITDGKFLEQNLPEQITELTRKYGTFFDIAEGHKNDGSPPKYYKSYFMAFDAEWYESGGQNIVLSYQIATLSRNGHCNRIEYVRQGDRLTLGEIVELGIRSVNNGRIPENHKNQEIIVFLISHNTTAEWSVLKDRNEPYITKRLVAIRKSPVTAIHPISIVLPGNYPTYVQIYDTMLLAPASHRSLKKLSSLLGPEDKTKKDIHERDKKRMDRFLERDPAGFEEYALRDSQATLEVFLLLQMELNRRAFCMSEDEEFVPERIFKTLASAAVRGFLFKEGWWFESYLESLNGERFKEPLKLIRRAYHGGRNESYFIGDTRKHPETKGKIWIDIDFSGCYPTCMALVPKIDVQGDIKQHALTYRLDRQKIALLKKENVPRKTIASVVRALRTDLRAPNSDRKKGSYFDLALKVGKEGVTTRQARLIRKTALCYDNTLIASWRRRWNESQSNSESLLNRYIIPGFARIQFEFPEGTLYPCLPVSHPKYGLIYPLRGETTVTAPEILLALEMGAKVDALASLELPVVMDSEHLPERYFLNHLSTLIKERGELAKKAKDGDQAAQVGEKLLKEFINSFYGKTAQAINPRKTYRPASGEMYKLQPSPISEPSVAAMITGLARAALSAVLVAIERYNKGKDAVDQVTVISATTDGMLIGLKAPPGYSITDDYYQAPKEKKENDTNPDSDPKAEKHPELVKGVKLDEVLERFGYGELWKMMSDFLPLRQMQQSRIELTNDNTAPYLEIKHMADWILSIKTRGQIGMLSTGQASIIAKFGLKPPLSEIIPDEDEYRRVFETGGMLRSTKEAEWIMEQVEISEAENSEIHTYTFYGLTSFNEIIKSGEDKDLTQKTADRRFNADFDWKRRLLRRPPEEGGGVLPFTVPHQDISSMLRHRNQMEAIRRTGFHAQPDKVMHRVAVKGRMARYRNGEPATLVRLFLRGCLHGHIPSTISPEAPGRPKKAGRPRGNGDKPNYTEMADALNLVWRESGLDATSRKKSWTRDDFKNAARPHDWEPGIMMKSNPLVALLARLADAFGAGSLQAEQQLFAGEEHQSLHKELVSHATVALLHAAREGVPPFPELAERGLLPDRASLVRTFEPHLTERGLDLCERAIFRKGQRPPQDRQRLVRIFRLIGLNHKDAARCASVLIQPRERGRKSKNPGEAKCLEQFLIAIQQPDIVSRSFSPGVVLGRLAKYNLSYSWLNRLQDVKFVPRTLSNTPANRDQIKRMAARLQLDPLPLIDVLVDA